MILAACANPKETARRIVEAGFMAIGGLEQWVTIRGEEAPKKEFDQIEGAGRFALATHADDFLASMKARLR